MLERERGWRAQAEPPNDDGAMKDAAAEMGEIDSELEAAIEYKIAVAGPEGAETVLDLLNAALRRRLR